MLLIIYAVTFFEILVIPNTTIHKVMFERGNKWKLNMTLFTY